MNSQDLFSYPLEDRNARLERAFVEEYILKQGLSLDELHKLPEAEAKRLMVRASIYACTKLEEVRDKALLAQELTGKG